MVQRLAAVAVSVWDHTQKPVECDWKRHWSTREQILSKPQLDRPLSLPLSPKNQHRRHSRSQRLHHPVLPHRCQNKTFRTSRWSWDHKNAENAKEWSEASVTSNDRADNGRFGNRCPLYSCVTSKDEMTTGGLYVIDGIDVVAILVPEEDVWQFEATETCTTETQMQDREQESIAVVDYEDPGATEAIEAFDARTGEMLDSEEVRKGRAKEVRELDEFEVKMEVDESEMHGLKHVRTQTVQQYDVDCVKEK